MQKRSATAGPTHKLFVDDSGNKDYSPDGVYGTKGGRTPYFVFGGVLSTASEAGRIERRMRSLKLLAFGTEKVEIKAHWLRRSDQREKRYLNKYGLSEDILKRFSDAAYNVILQSDCMLVACVIDKAEVQRQYKDRAYYAPAIAYDCLLQRVQQEMVSCQGEAHVTIDSMTGATPSGNQHAMLLRRQHNQLQKRGSSLRRGMTFDRIGGVAFRDSAADERLQLADLVSYAVFRQFVDHGPAWEDDTQPRLQTYEYFERLEEKFRNRNGRIQGYGLVKFPMNKRVPWMMG